MVRRLVPVLFAVAFLAAVPTARAGSLTPGQLHRAYQLPLTAKKPSTVAIVTAYDAPSVASDLRTFTRRFHIASCRAGCFREVNQRGASRPLPVRDPTGQDWIVEASLGTQVARGICQNCRILLVEADSATKADLSAAVATAARLGAREIATSFTPAESPSDVGLVPAYSHPGVVVTAATGDTGFATGPVFPASMPGVVAVGGTHLTLGRGGRYVSERAWSSGGSGCSSVFSAPVWQRRAARSLGCGSSRTIADIAAVADPGALVHIGTPIGGESGWFEVGGTSLGSPLIAATFALAGGVPKGTSPGARLASARAGLRDVTRGANGTCGRRAICTARRGADGPTGVGTPRGLAAFRGR